MTFKFARRLFSRMFFPRKLFPRKLFHVVLGSWRPFVGFDGTLARGRPNTGTRPAMEPVPMRPGLALSDWLTQTVAYHH